MSIAEALLESWNRQCSIVTDIASKIDASNRSAKPSEDGWPLDTQLAHIHQVRRYWLSEVDPERAATLGPSYLAGSDTPIADLDALKTLLDQSGNAIGDAMRDHLERGTGKIETETTTYDHPVMFLQHMVWHEGWHVGLICLALRLNGQELPQEWEEEHMWGKWRTERW